MDLTTMLVEVRDIIGEETANADFWSDTELTRYLNEAQYRFMNEERWPWLVTEFTSQLLAGDPDLELTEGVSFSRHVNFALTKVGDSRMYVPVRVDPAKGFDLRTRYSTNTTASYPEWFYITSVADADDDGAYTWVAKFIPTPTSDMDVDAQYTRVPVALSAGNDTPDVPIEYRKALVHRAAGEAWLKELNGKTKAQEQFELYASVVEQARAEWQNQPDDDPVVAGKDEPQYGPGRGSVDPWLLRMPETLTGP